MTGKPPTPSDKPRRFPLSLDKMAARPTGPAAASAVPVAGTRTLLRPQAPLHQAARDGLRQAAPQGVGLDSAQVRRRMVDRLKADGISHPAVLLAMATVPRHLFVDTALVNQAYEDTSLPIGLGQTISKPSVVASMIQLLCERPGMADKGLAADDPAALKPLGSCLEIGTGCGYQAAVLACLARRVVSIERLKDLHLKARGHLDTLRQLDRSARDVRLIYGDGMLGHAPGGPYDTIIAAAGGSALPEAWLTQLAPGGRLVAPMSDGAGRGQVLTVVDRLADGSLVHSRFGAVHFVPLKSGIT
jgi:protein-L-isoaspartate(D-aspartate) O-methyltransferase